RNNEGDTLERFISKAPPSFQAGTCLYVGFVRHGSSLDCRRVAKKLKLQERRAVIPSRRSLAACRPLGFLGRSRAPSRIGGHTRGTYGVGTYPGLHHWDGGPGAAAAE